MRNVDLRRNDKKNKKSFTILVATENPSMPTKMHRLSAAKIKVYVAAYTILVAVIVSMIFLFSPIRDTIATKSSALTKEERTLIDELSKKLNFLNSEVELLRTTNQRLKNAIERGDSVGFVPPAKKNNPVNQVNKSIPAAGNLFFIVNRILAEFGINNYGNGIFTKPINGFISKDYEVNKGHFGIDYVVKIGTPVYSAGNGYVIFADYTTNDGYMLIIAHNDDYITVYKHCSSLLKKTRDIVEQGEIIALSGNTGILTTGPHLHFEIWKNGQAIDPKTVLVN